MRDVCIALVLFFFLLMEILPLHTLSKFTKHLLNLCHVLCEEPTANSRD